MALILIVIPGAEGDLQTLITPPKLSVLSGVTGTALPAEAACLQSAGQISPDPGEPSLSGDTGLPSPLHESVRSAGDNAYPPPSDNRSAGALIVPGTWAAAAAVGLR